jgi:hypothetical protein
MMDRRRRNDILRKAVAVVALIACLSIGIGVIAYLAVQIVAGRAAKSETTTTQAAPSSRPLVPIDKIVPLQIRPVQELRSPSQCPPEGAIPQVPPSDVVTLCDFGRGVAFVLGALAI